MPRKKTELQAEPEPAPYPYPIEAPESSRKAEDWELEPPDALWQQPRCRNCGQPMWTRQPEKHDICEECGYLMRDQQQTYERQQRQHHADRIVNPFDGGPFAGLTGSLPTPK